MDSTRAPLVLAVGRTRDEAARLFGADLDDFQLATYDDLAARLDALSPTFVGFSAGAGMADGVRLALAARDRHPGMEVVVELPDTPRLSEELQEALEGAGARAAEVRHYRQRPCLVVAGASADAAPSANGAADTTLTAALAAARRPRDPSFQRQVRAANKFELDAARARARDLEAELDETSHKLLSARAELRSLKRRPASRRLTARAQQALQDDYRSADSLGTGSGSLPARAAYLLSGLLGADSRRGRLLTLVGFALVAVVLLVGLPVVFGLATDGVGALVGLSLALVLLACLGVGAAVLLVVRQLADVRSRQQRLATDVRLVVQETEALRTGADAVDLVLRQQGKAIAALPTAEPATAAEVDEAGTGVGEVVQATMNLFQMVRVEAAVPPMSHWVAAPDLVLWTVDTFLKDRPGLVVECGSGVSTLFLALTARQYAVPTRIVALEHDRSFARRTRELLAHHGVADFAEVRHAPLARTSLSDHHTPWYAEDAIADLDGIGLLLVDGPPAATGPRPRFPAVPLLRDKLAAHCTILADDVVRAEDREVAESWRPLLPDFRYELLPLRKGAAVLRREA